MNKIEFVEQMRRSLSSIDDYTFVNNTVAYYEDYIESHIRMGKSEEQVMEELSSPELSLEESFAKYKQGMDLLLKCNQAIDKVEKELMILEENGINDEF